MNEHPDIWLFTENILDIIEMARRDSESLAIGYWTRRNPEQKYLLKEDMLQMSWTLFVQIDEPDTDRFLTAANHILRPFGKDVCTNIIQINDFRNINNYDDIVIMFPSIHRYRIVQRKTIGHIVYDTCI